MSPFYVEEKITDFQIVSYFCQAPAPAGLSLALFPNYPAAQPDPTRPDPTGILNFLGNISTCIK